MLSWPRLWAATSPKHFYDEQILAAFWASEIERGGKNIVKRMLFGCTLIFCGFAGTLSTWVLQHVTTPGNVLPSVVLTESEAAGPFTIYLIFLLAGLSLCVFELVQDHKHKKP